MARQPRRGIVPRSTAPASAILQLVPPPLPAGEEDGTIAVNANDGVAYFWDAVAGQWRPLAVSP